MSVCVLLLACWHLWDSWLAMARWLSETAGTKTAAATAVLSLAQTPVVHGNMRPHPHATPRSTSRAAAASRGLELEAQRSA